MKKFLKEQFTVNTIQIATMGMLIALEIVLNRFASINLWNIKIGFAFIPVVLAGMLMGPVKGGIVGALSDFIGAMLFGIGPYFPGFTLSAFLRGILYGALLYKKPTILKISITAFIDQMVIALFIVSYWIFLLYNANASSYWAVVYSRLIQVIPLLPVEILITAAMPKLLVERLKPYMEMSLKKNNNKQKSQA